MTDLPAPLLLQVADLPEAQRRHAARRDQRRTTRCAAPTAARNVLHLLPSRAMLADALMQYPRGQALAQPAAGHRPDRRRQAATPTRSAAAAQEVPAAHRGRQALDLRARRPAHRHRPCRDRRRGGALHPGPVATTCWWSPTSADDFGDDLAYRTTDPAPGRRHPGPGADRLGAAVRAMGRDAAAAPLPEAGRALDDAARLRRLDGGARRRRGGDARRRHRSGRRSSPSCTARSSSWRPSRARGCSFRAWDGQLRQPVLLADARSLVSVSPAAGLPAPILRAGHARHRPAGDRHATC